MNDRKIEDKVKEYLRFGADTDLWGNIPKGCSLTMDDFKLIEDLTTEAIMYDKSLLSTDMKIKFLSKLENQNTNYSVEELIELLLSVP